MTGKSWLKYSGSTGAGDCVYKGRTHRWVRCSIEDKERRH